jgi:sugar phosphate isomerase/epimerase
VNVRTIGIAAFEYHRPVDEALIRVRKLGVGHCELVTPGDVTPETARSTAAVAAETGVTVTAVASLSKPNTIDDDGDVAPMLRLLDDSIEAARLLGAPFAITYFGGHPTRGEAEAIDRYARLVAPSIRRAEDAGVTVLVENHFSHAPGEVTNTAAGCRDLVQAVGSDHFAVNFDYCNFAIGGQPLVEAYDVLRPYIRNVHVKDARPVDPARDADYDGRIVTDLVHGEFRFVAVGDGISDHAAVLSRVVADDLPVSVTIEAHVPDADLDECFRRGLALCRGEGL